MRPCDSSLRLCSPLILGLLLNGSLLLAADAPAPALKSESPTPLKPLRKDAERNALDPRKDSVKAGEQSDSASDVELLHKLRQTIIKDKSLSGKARNIKIFTRDGGVLLQGQVKSLVKNKALNL